MKYLIYEAVINGRECLLSCSFTVMGSGLGTRKVWMMWIVFSMNSSTSAIAHSMVGVSRWIQVSISWLGAELICYGSTKYYVVAGKQVVDFAIWSYDLWLYLHNSFPFSVVFVSATCRSSFWMSHTCQIKCHIWCNTCFIYHSLDWLVTLMWSSWIWSQWWLNCPLRIWSHPIWFWVLTRYWKLGSRFEIDIWNVGVSLISSLYP